MTQYYFGKRSLKLLSSLDERLLAVLYTSLSHSYIDFTILETQRTVAKQKELYMQGLTKTLNSKHLTQPKSLAVDVAPLIRNESGRSIIPWQDHSYFYFLAGNILSAAQRFCYGKDFYIRWGGDWNRNRVFVDNDPKETFTDLVHFEIIEQGESS